jgi:hypothetical protein
MLSCSDLDSGTSRAGNGRGQSVSDSMISSSPEIVSRAERDASCNESGFSDCWFEKLICGYCSCRILISKLEPIGLVFLLTVIHTRPNSQWIHVQCDCGDMTVGLIMMFKASIKGSLHGFEINYTSLELLVSRYDFTMLYGTLSLRHVQLWEGIA